MCTGIFTLVVLVFCWLWGDVSVGVKLLFSLLFVGSFAWLFWKDYGPAAFVVTQCVLIAVTGAATFGLDWLMRRVR